MSVSSFAAPPGDSDLDRYVLRERPALDFLTDQARRAPWWAISFLVHALALVVLWRWPLALGAREEATDIIIGRLWEPPPDAPPPPPPVDPPTPPDELPFVPEPSLQLSDPKPNIDTEFLEDPPELSFDDVAMDPLLELLPPEIAILEIPNAPPRRSRAILKGRDELYKLTRGGPGGRGGGPPGRPGVAEIYLGLVWLAKAQSRDGSWDAQAWGGGKPYNVAMTGLALLAFHGAGYTAERGQFKETVRRGLRWLASHQRADGSFPWTTFYEQGIATMAVAEAYAMSGSPPVGRMAQRAVDYVCELQPDHGGYRYGGAVPRGEGDMSVTGWQIMAIKSAQCAETLDVPEQAIERARTFLSNAARDYGASSYIISSPSPGSLAVSSVGMICRIFTERDGDLDDEINAAATTLLSKETDKGTAIYGGATKELTRNLYYTYYSALAMYQAGEEHWRLWKRSYYDPLRLAMVRTRNDPRGRYIRGSWDPAKYKWAKRGGRIYATAMAVLSLEVPYRYLRIYRSRR